MNQNSKKQSFYPAALGMVCIVVLVILGRYDGPGLRSLTLPGAGNSFYNLLVQGFHAGQLNIITPAPQELTRLANPYDRVADQIFLRDFQDMSYYKGKLYLYYGVAPVLVLYWPYYLVTGHFLSDQAAAFIFLATGYLALAFLLQSVWKRYYQSVSFGVLALGLLAVGVALGAIEAEWWGCEVPLSCGFAFTLLSVVAIWQAMHSDKRKVIWLLLASLTYGLAIASRPNLLPGAMILIIPLIYEWRAGRKMGPLIFAIVCPMALIGAGLMLYNYLRFENALDFGWNYQLGASGNGHRVRQFSPSYFGYNVYYYFLEPMRWTAHFPFLQTYDPPVAPVGHEPGGKDCGGILLVNYPLALTALAVAWVWRRKAGNEATALRLLVVMASILFVSSGLLLCLFTNAWNRFELDFLPALMILSVIGVFHLEQELTGAGRLIARVAWCLLVADTLAFNTLASVEGYATGDAHNGNFLVNDGEPVEALPYLQKALDLEPGSANFHAGLGTAYFRQRRLDDAIVEFKRAFEIESNFPEAVTAHNNFGYCLLETGRVDDAIVQFKITLEMKPGFAEAHNTLGDCFFQTGRTNEAIMEYEKAVKLNPDYAEAQNNLGYAFFLLGRTKEAAVHFQKASEVAPNNADFHNNAGSCLLQTGQLDDAIAQFRMAIELQPHFAQAYHNLAEAFRRKGMQAQAKANDQKAAEFSAKAGTDK